MQGQAQPNFSQARADARESQRRVTNRAQSIRVGQLNMLRIEKDTDGCVTRLKLSGRIESDHIAAVRSAMNDGGTRKILDLGDITLVDVAVVRFLISCENEGVELVQCPLYVREWMLRERAEGVQPENA